MYTLLGQLYQKYCGCPQYNIAILGLQHTGKSQMLRSLKNQSGRGIRIKQDYKPTIGLNIARFVRNCLNFLIWDLGGKQSIRKIWESYYPYCHGFLFLFDDRIDEGFQCLSICQINSQSILSHPQMAQIPFVVFVRDKQYLSQVCELIKELDGDQILYNRFFFVKLQPYPQYSAPQLQQYLKVLYQNIRELDINIRK